MCRGRRVGRYTSCVMGVLTDLHDCWSTGSINMPPIIPDSAVERMCSGATDRNSSQDEKMTRLQGRGVMPAEAGIQAFRISWIPA